MIEKDSYRKHKTIEEFLENGEFFTVKLKQKNNIKFLLKYCEGISVQIDKARQSKIVKDYQSLCDLKTELQHIYRLWHNCKVQGKLHKVETSKINREYKMLRQKNKLLHEKLHMIIEHERKIFGQKDNKKQSREKIANLVK